MQSSIIAYTTGTREQPSGFSTEKQEPKKYLDGFLVSFGTTAKRIRAIHEST
jgi:hypothetical protein